MLYCESLIHVVSSVQYVCRERTDHIYFCNAFCFVKTGIINPTVFSVAFKEWKYCQFELESMKGVNWMECPCCEKEQHSCHVDGNMKLYRYKNSGL